VIFYRPAWHDGCAQEFQANLSPLKKHLCEKSDLICVIGKQKKSVPVILTKDMLDGINLLLKHRSYVGVNSHNNYLFPRVFGGSLEHLQTWDCLRKIAKKDQIKNPDRIIST